MSRKSTNHLYIVLFVAFIVRLIWMLGTDNYISGDVGERLRVAWEWAQNPQIFPSEDWLPFHHYLVGGLMMVTHDPLWSPRILYFLLSVLTVVPLYYFIRNEFNEEVALFAALQFALFQTQIFLSSVTLTEVPFVLFVVTGFMCLSYAYWQEKNRLSLLMCAAFAFSLANLLRFEGWMMTTVAIAWYYLSSRNLKDTTVLAALMSIPILWVMYMTSDATGNGLYGILHSDAEVQNSMHQDSLGIFNRFAGISLGFPITFFIALPFGIYIAIRKGMHSRYLLISLLPLLILYYKVMGGTLMPAKRYMIVYAVMLFPYCIMTYLWLYKTFFTRIKVGVFMVILMLGQAVLVGVPLVVYDLENRKMLKYDKGFFESAEYAKLHLKGERLMLDQVGCSEANAWMVYSQLPMATHDTTLKAGVVDWISGRSWMGEKFDSTELVDRIEERDVSHVVLFKEGVLERYLHFDDDTEHLEDFVFINEFEYDDYEIYRIEDSEGLNLVETDTDQTQLAEIREEY